MVEIELNHSNQILRVLNVLGEVVGPEIETLDLQILAEFAFVAAGSGCL